MAFSKQAFSQEERNKLKKEIDVLTEENQRLREMLDGKVRNIENKPTKEPSNELESMLC